MATTSPNRSGITVADVHPFEYVAWLEDHQLPADDEDFEWCAVILVLAESEAAAQEWGDVLVLRQCAASKDTFLRSTVEPHVCDLPLVGGTKHPCPNYPALSRPGNEALAMPVVAYGEAASADYIGW